MNESPRRKQRGISMKFNKRGKPRSIRLKKNKAYITRIFIIAFSFILLWQVFVMAFQVPIYFLPTPLDVFKTIVKKWPLLLSEGMPTIIETLLGLLLGTFFGVFNALLMAFFRPLRFWILPILLISQALPTFAIAPLLVLWFGYGITAKILTTMLMIFFPITSSFYDGLRQTPQKYLDLAKVMNGLPRRIVLCIRIPSALPAFATGLRTACVFAPIGAVVGEWVGSNRGLGYLMLMANARLEIDLLFAALFGLTCFTILLYFTIDKLLLWLIPWKKYG